jgi:hypothetical protein
LFAIIDFPLTPEIRVSGFGFLLLFYSGTSVVEFHSHFPIVASEFPRHGMLPHRHLWVSRRLGQSERSLALSRVVRPGIQVVPPKLG